eukprot:156168_1
MLPPILSLADGPGPHNPKYRFELYRVIFLSALSLYVLAFILQIINQEFRRRKFGKTPGFVQLYGRPILLLSSILILISHIDMFGQFGILTERAVIFLEFHFLLGIFGFLGIYIFVMTRSIEGAVSNDSETRTTFRLSVLFYCVLGLNGYLSTGLRVVINQSWTIVYQDIIWLVYIWATIARLTWAYYRLVEEIRSSHPTRQQQKIKRMESAIRRWRNTVVLVAAFALVLTVLRLTPMKGLLGENTFQQIQPTTDFDAAEIAFEISELIVLAVYLVVVWEPLEFLSKRFSKEDQPTMSVEEHARIEMSLSFSDITEQSVISALPAEEPYVYEV